jgi:PAS domain S-box-containing protein
MTPAAQVGRTAAARKASSGRGPAIAALKTLLPAELVISTGLLPRLADTSSDAVVVVAGDGRIVLVNARAERLFGYRREELLGQVVEMLVPERMRAHGTFRAGLFAEPHSGPPEAAVAAYGRRKDGSEFPAEIGLSSIETADGVLTLATIRDDTERRLAAIIYATDEAIIGTDLDATITSWNPGAQALYGFSEAEARGRPVSILVPEDCAEEVPELLRRLTRGEHVDRHETVRVHKDGSVLDVSLTITPMCDADGRVVGACSISRHVRDRTRVESELITSRNAARTASRAKSSFLASMSHELRTPLNGVIGLTNLLADTSLNPIQRKYLDGLRRSGDALLAVINDVLDFSKIEAGQVELDRTDFDLHTAVEDAIHIVAGLAHAKKLEINYWIHPDVPQTVNGDHARLSQVLLNLLANAVKFTSTGEVTLRVTADGSPRLRFSVADTGIGINEAEAIRLFEAFTQADQSTTRRYGGTGLGLAISRQLVELMAGEIGAAPRPGGGSVFWFTAPLPAVLAAAGVARSIPDLHARRTLIVDDNETNRMILEHLLRGWGLACESLDRPTAALATLEKASQEGRPFELVVLDFNLPRMDGADLVLDIRNRPELRTLRLLLLTSGAVDGALLAAIGGSRTLTKPASPVALHAAILEAFAGVKPVRRRSRPAVRAQIDRGLTVLLAEDNEINTTVAKGLLIAMGVRPELARTGREAVEMAAGKAYDVIFMDCQMPEVDGFDATHQIREAENAARVPIIAMTAYALAGDRERCIKAGMDDYISKPLRREDVETVFERWLAKPDAAATGAVAAAGDSRAGARDRGVLDQARIGELRGILTDVKRRKLAAAFAKQTTASVAAIVAAAGRGDQDEVKRLTHQLAGTSASVGAGTLAACCEKVGEGRGEKTGAAEALQLAALRTAARRAISAVGRQLAG